jgi:hypothetical protein
MYGRRRGQRFHPPIIERFLSKISKGPKCWLWTGYHDPVDGYGRFRLPTGVTTAQRAAWVLFHGPIPEGLEACHKCDVRLCVNPEHIFLGTHQENIDDATMKGAWDRRIHPTNNRGETNGMAKLNREKVIAIRGMVSRESRAVVAKRFGVTVQTITNVAHGYRWGHV